MGEYLDLPAKVSPSLREEKGHAGITLDTYQILPPSSNHIYTSGDGKQPKDQLNWIKSMAIETGVLHVMYNQKSSFFGTFFVVNRKRATNCNVTH